MKLLPSWKESLYLCWPDNLKPFLRGVISSLFDVYGVFFRLAGVAIISLIATSMLLLAIGYLMPSLASGLAFGLLFFFLLIGAPILLFLSCLAARPTTIRKDYDYF